MRLHHRILQHRKLTTCASAFLAMGLFVAPALTQDAPPIPDQEQPEVLTRGPVHEAFAEPVNMQSEDGQVAPTAPPANIEETPPDERPEGDQFTWVPGYWSWDVARKSYIWVSACWRAAPPKMSWTPGYWSETNGGWEWIAGYWAPEDSQEIEYLPAPPVPDSIEAPGPPPSVDQSWVPPCQYWTDGKYVERPGYWLTTQPGWMWVASHYVWTPRGYVFCAGHWDYPLEDRGVLFAPVAIPPAAYARPGYVYSPSVVVSTDVLSANLFVSLRYSHYFFGDYYDDAAQVGVVSWCERPSSRTWYDPMYEYDRASLRISVTDWDQRQRHEFDIRRSDKDLRPPKTYRELETRVAKAPADQRQNITVVQSLKTVVNNTTINNTTINNNRTTVNNNRSTVNNNNTSKIKFQKIDSATQTTIAKQAADERKVNDQRKARETVAKPANAAAKPAAAPKEATPQLATERKEPSKPAPAANPAPTPTERGRGAANSAQPQVAPAPAPAAERGRGTVDSNAAAEPAPAERGRGAATPAAERKAPVAQREVRAEQPEKVKLDSPPAKGRAASAGKGAPPQPADEVGRKGDAKEAPKAEKADEKPTSRPAAGRSGR